MSASRGQGSVASEAAFERDFEYHRGSSGNRMGRAAEGSGSDDDDAAAIRCHPDAKKRCRQAVSSFI